MERQSAVSTSTSFLSTPSEWRSPSALLFCSARWSKYPITVVWPPSLWRLLIMVISSNNPDLSPLANFGVALHRIGYRRWDSRAGGPALAQGRRGRLGNCHLTRAATECRDLLSSVSVHVIETAAYRWDVSLGQIRCKSLRNYCIHAMKAA